MASVRTFTLPHYHAYPIHVALFKDVANASYLRSQLLAANPDFDYAFLDASMVGTLSHCFCIAFSPSIALVIFWMHIRSLSKHGPQSRHRAKSLNLLRRHLVVHPCFTMPRGLVSSFSCLDDRLGH